MRCLNTTHIVVISFMSTPHFAVDKIYSVGDFLSLFLNKLFAITITESISELSTSCCSLSAVVSMVTGDNILLENTLQDKTL